MTGTVTGNQAFGIAQRYEQTLARELSALEEDVRSHEEALGRAESEMEGAWYDLAAAILPSLDDTCLDAAAARLKLPLVGAAAVRAALVAELEKHGAEVERLENDPTWRDREAGRNEVAIRLAELKDAIAPLRESVTALENEPYFAELIRIGWDSDSYLGKWWQLTHYVYWKHGDLVVERHGARLRAERFADIRAKYLAEQEALRALYDERRRLRQKHEAIEQLERAMEEAREGLRTAHTRVLEQTRGKVVEHLRPLSADDIAALFVGDEQLLLLLKRVVGLTKKRDYLQAIGEEWLRRPEAQLTALAAKVKRAKAKYGKVKNWNLPFDRDEVMRRFPDKADSWARRRQRWHTARDRLAGFHEWDRGSLASDFLWWDLFFDGRLDGDFIPEVHHHHHVAPTARATVAAAERQRTFDEDRVLDVS